MENGFGFEMYETIFKNCFTNCSSYKNGNLQMSLFGLNSNVNQVSHFADITLEQNSVKLQDNQVVVNDRFRPTLIPQLETSIYNIDYSKVNENCYYLQDLVSA